MLSSISWANFIIGIAVLSVIYYLFVILRYYPSELKEFVSGKRRLAVRQSQSSGTTSDQLTTDDDFDESIRAMEATDEFLDVESLVEELKLAVADNAERDLVSQQFKQCLQDILKQHPNIKNSALRSSVNELIISECEKYSVVTLSEQDLERLWVSSV